MTTTSLRKWKVGWGYTAKCNMSCPFCYSRKVRQKDDEIPLEKAKRFVDDNAAEIDSINYGTGECVLSHNWGKLAAYVRNNYPTIRQSLTTNGSLAHQIATNKCDAEQIVRMIDEIDVSLDFCEHSKHNQSRRNENAFNWSLDTLEFCKKNELISTIVMVGYAETLTPQNLDGIFSLASNYHSFVRINVLRPVKGTQLPPPSNTEMHIALQYILCRYKTVSLCDPLFGSLYDPSECKPQHVINSCRILPDGMITPSTYLIEPQWFTENICNSTQLRRISDADAFQKIESAIIPKACNTCNYQDNCRGGATDRRILHYDSLTERDPYCPFRDSNMIYEQIPLQRSGRINSYPTVHDGYLPTLIFDY